MTTAPRKYANDQTGVELRSGDCMTQAEFHRIYETMPDDFKAELIGGIVYVASPLKRSHGQSHVRLSSIFDAYQAATPGVQACDNATVILSKTDEVQPDLFLRILPEYGGQTRDTSDQYVAGAPELVAEIAYSSRSIDLHVKRKRYAKFGVLEYIVLCLQPKELRWFDLQAGVALEAEDSIWRSCVFPGLWIHVDSLLRLDYQGVMTVLKQGLSSPEHATFVAELAARR